MEFSSQYPEMLYELLKWRRDVRHFKTESIDPRIWSNVKQAVDFSPSVGNSQPWRLIEVESSELRKCVIKNFETENKIASEIYSDASRESYLNLKLAGLRDAPIHLAVFTDTTPISGQGLGRQTMPETLRYSTVTAIHTLWLATRSYNLGMGWVSILNPAKIESLLNVPQNWKLTAYLCIGKPATQEQTPELERVNWQSRKPIIWLKK